MQTSLFDRVPIQLKSLPDWIPWHYEQDCNGKLQKKPDVPAGWITQPQKTFDELIPTLKPTQGIGIAFRETNNIVGIDIDHVPDDAIPPALKAILVAGKNGYIERSVSKTGFHIIGECSFKPLLLQMFANYNGGTGAKKPAKNIELYATGRFFTVSGYTLYPNYGNIDAAVIMAWELITEKSMLASVAAVYDPDQRSGSLIVDTEKTTSSTMEASVAAEDFPVRPENAYTDEEIEKMPLLSLEKTFSIMYNKKPLLKRILENEGYNLSDEYYKMYSNSEVKDRTPSGFDQEICSVLTFWFRRYGKKTVTTIFKKSKLFRNDKSNPENYVETTVDTAFNNAIEYFPATPYFNDKIREGINAWIAWKKEVAVYLSKKPA